MKIRLTNTLMNLVKYACISFLLNDWNPSHMQVIQIKFPMFKILIMLEIPHLDCQTLTGSAMLCPQ